MKLVTKELEEKFKEYPFYSQENKLGNAKVIVKYFNPCGAGTWLITEAEKQENGKYLFFGYCNLGDSADAEFGYVSQEELESIQLPFGLSIERDLYLEEETTVAKEMRNLGIEVPDYYLKEESFEI